MLHSLPNALSTPSITKTNHYWLNLLHTLIYTISLEEGLKSNFPLLVLHKEIMDSPYLRIPLINIRNIKDKTLDSPRILTSYSNTGNKEMNFSTGWMKLVRVANNQAVVHKSFIGRYFPCVSGFSLTNLRKKKNRKRKMRFHPAPH